MAVVDDPAFGLNVFIELDNMARGDGNGIGRFDVDRRLGFSVFADRTEIAPVGWSVSIVIPVGRVVF